MKKGFILLSGIAFILAIGMTSCKKDYTCECVVKDSSGTVVSGGTTDITIHATKKKAKDGCQATVQSGGMTETCSIK